MHENPGSILRNIRSYGRAMVDLVGRVLLRAVLAWLTVWFLFWLGLVALAWWLRAGRDPR